MSLVGMRLTEPDPLKDAYCPSQARYVALSRHGEIISQKYFMAAVALPPASSTTAGGTYEDLHHSTLTIQLLFDINDTLAQICLRFNIAGDFLDGIHYRSVIASA